MKISAHMLGRQLFYPCLFNLLLTVLVSTLTAQKANFELAEKFTTQKMEKMASSLSVDPNWFKDETDEVVLFCGTFAWRLPHQCRIQYS